MITFSSAIPGLCIFARAHLCRSHSCLPPSAAEVQGRFYCDRGRAFAFRPTEFHTSGRSCADHVQIIYRSYRSFPRHCLDISRHMYARLCMIKALWAGGTCVVGML